MYQIFDPALNMDGLDVNRRHRHHRRRHPSEIRGAVIGRDSLKGWDSKKLPASHYLKSIVAVAEYNAIISLQHMIFADGAEGISGSDGDRESTKLTSLSPGPVIFPVKVRVCQIACGLHHSGDIFYLLPCKLYSKLIF